jgi:hypothetical protein
VQMFCRPQDENTATIASSATPRVAGVQNVVDSVADRGIGVLVQYLAGLPGSALPLPTGAFPDSASPRSTLGIDEGLSANPFVGTIDEVRVARRTRSAAFVRVDAASRAGELAAIVLIER